MTEQKKAGKPVQYKFVSWAKSKTVPKAEEVPSTDAVPYVKWGKDRDFPNGHPLFLNTLYLESPSQTGIINGKLFYLLSGGYKITTASPELDAQVKAFEKNELSDYSFGDILEANFLDWEMYNGCCIRGVWNFMDGSLAFIEPLGFDAVRTNEEGTRYWISEDWTQSQQSYEKTKFREIPLIDLNKREGEFICYFKKQGKKKDKGNKVYPDPPYAGAIKSLMTEIEIQGFHFFETQNSFKSGTIVHLPGAKGARSKEEKQKLARTIKQDGTATEAAGGVVVLFGEGGTEQPTVLQLNGNDQDKRYLQTENNVAETILRAHSAPTPGLFGMSRAGSLGNRDELENAFEIFKNTYIKARQKPLVEWWNWIINKVAGIPSTFEMMLPPVLFGEVSTDQNSKVAKALNGMSPLVANKVLENLTPNEIRALASLPPLPGGDVIASTPPVAAPPVQMHKECCAHTEEMLAKDPVLKAFEKSGKKKDGYIIIRSNQIPNEPDAEWINQHEEDMLAQMQTEKHYFATVLNERQKNVLGLINDGHDASSIAKALNLSVQEVMDTYNELSQKGLIKKDGELSSSGKRYLEVNEIPADQYEIRYSYELRPDAPRLIGESRSFCKKMVDLDRLYTRQEIEQISGAVQRDVWRYRGGWYHNPETNQNTPFCRHSWYQHITVKK